MDAARASALVAVRGATWRSRRGAPQRPGLPAARRRRLGGVLRVRRRPDRHRAGHRAARPSPTRRRARTWSRRPSGSGCSASSRPPELARAARDGACASRSRRTSGCSSATTRWTSYVIVPLFALANAASGSAARSWRTPTPPRSTLGILLGYVRRQAHRHRRAPPGWSPASSRGRLPPPVGWAAVAGGGTVAGIGFTVVAADRHARVQRRRSWTRPRSASCRRAVCAALLTWACSACIAHAAARRAGCGRCSARAEPVTDLAVPVDPERDHIRGPRGRAGHAGRVRRLRVPVLRPGRAGRPRAARRTRRRSATSGATCRSPTCTRTRSSPPRRPRRRRRRARSGRCTTLLLEHQDALTAADLLGYAATARPRRRALPRDLRKHTRRRADRRGRRLAPTWRACRARRRSSSTATATTAPTTSTRCWRRCARPRLARSSARGEKIVKSTQTHEERAVAWPATASR